MDSKIILEVLNYALYFLNTNNVPYKWDFCRIALKGNIRLCINIGSYFVAYAAFVFWFTKYVLSELKVLAGERLGKRHWYSAIGLSLSTATQLLWPAFLITTYFVSCSFYPWFSATVVLFLNVRFYLSPLIVDGERKIKSIVQAAFARWKRKTGSLSSTDSLDYNSVSEISEESLTFVFDSSEQIADMEKKETVSTEEQPLERLKSLVLSFIRGGIDKIKSFFQAAFARLNIFQVQSESSSGSNMENKDRDITGKQSIENTSVPSRFDGKKILYTIFEKARSYFVTSDEQSDSSGHELSNTFDLFENTQRLDKSVSEPQQPRKFNDDRNQPQANRVRNSTIW